MNNLKTKHEAALAQLQLYMQVKSICCPWPSGINFPEKDDVTEYQISDDSQDDEGAESSDPQTILFDPEPKDYRRCTQSLDYVWMLGHHVILIPRSPTSSSH